ncbi:LemA family protein [hydrothermal vent metagenome]|uniref:LemA family protein n=1 Tax=hydrothermal vent metagenome TaxID=652676 RepID=A0A3B0VGH7_9ZZZZ
MRGSSMFWVVIGAVIVVGIWLVSLYNRMVKRRNHVEDGWSGIDVQLKRRHNLIPNLVNTVKKYASHEKDVMESVTRLRNITKSATESSASQEQLISNALSGLMVQVEAYPELKADANFRDLQKQLSEIESEIQYARRYFNGAVREYNTLIQSFPAVLIANKFGFDEAEFFELDDNDVARNVPQVDFK